MRYTIYGLQDQGFVLKSFYRKEVRFFEKNSGQTAEVFSAHQALVQKSQEGNSAGQKTQAPAG